jgi:predicted ATP-grasp superfamily ATP-dependent carboligase
MLSRLGIPHPPTTLGPIDDVSGWLLKKRGGSGGGHIRRANGRVARPGTYLQKEMPGEPFSVACLANGRGAQMIAVTRQWTSPSRHAPWRYGGAVEPGRVPVGLRQEIEGALTRVAAATGLRGLASADLLIDGDRWCLLEINPRPGATLDILDRRPTPLFRRHCEAAAGHLGADEDPPAEAAGTRIVYAQRAIPFVPDVAWPAYTLDRPQPGARIAAGAPICTVSAAGSDAAAVGTMLEARVGNIVDLLNDRNVSRGWLIAATQRQRADEAAR